MDGENDNSNIYLKMMVCGKDRRLIQLTFIIYESDIQKGDVFISFSFRSEL